MDTEPRPLWQRISDAIEAAGYVPQSDQSMVELGRRLAKAYPGKVTPLSARRNVYRWIDPDPTKGTAPNPKWRPVLEKVLGVPANSFFIPRSRREQDDVLASLVARMEAAEAEIAQLRDERAGRGGERGERSSGRK